MAVKVIHNKSPWSSADCGAPFWFDAETTDRWGRLVDGMMQLSDNTHDVPELSQFEHHYVFVYGTLKKNCGNNFMMRNATYVAKAWTKLKCFVMLDGGAPAVMTDTGNDKKAIQGEVYKVTVSQLKALDRFEANGQIYKRRRVVLDTEDKEEIKAWMYFGIEGVFQRYSKKCPHFVRKLNNLPYYTFTKVH